MRILINFKLLVTLLAVVVLVGVAVHLLHSYQEDRSTSGLLRQAEHAREQGNLSRASRLMYRYLLAVPHDNGTRAQYGLLLEEVASSSPDPAARGSARYQAAAVFDEVLLREPERPDIRRRLALVAGQLGQWDRALEHLTILRPSVEGDGELEYLFGQCYEATGRPEESLAWYDRATRNSPESVESSVRLAILLHQGLDAAERARRAKLVGRSAAQVMDDLVAVNPKAFRAYLERSLFRKRLPDLEGAEADLSRAAELAPDEADVLLAAADLARLRGRTAEADQHLRRGAELHRRDPRFHLALAASDHRAGDRANAAQKLREGLNELPGHPDLLWPLADLLLEDGDLEAARKAVADLRKLGWSPARVDYLAARVLAREGRWADARKALELVRPLLADWPELTLQTDLLLGRCYEQLGDTERRLAVYRRAVSLDAGNVAARQGLGSALVSLGQLDDALAEVQSTVTAPTAPASAWIALARLLLLRNLRSATGPQRWQEVYEALDQAEKRLPDSVEVPILRAEARLAQKQPAEAAKGLEEACARRPDQVDLWIVRVDLARQQGQPEEARRLLEQAEKRLGDQVELRLARARGLLARGGPVAADLLALADGLEGFKEAEQVHLLGTLADICRQAGRDAEAADLWARQAALRPKDVRVRFTLFELALRAGDEPGMKRWLEELQQAEGPDEPLGRYAEVGRLIWLARRGDRKALGTARALLTQVALRRPSWHRVALRQAEIDELENNLERALENYQRALELGERQPAVVRRVVDLLTERNRGPEADELLRRLQAQAPLSQDLQRMAAEVSLRQQDFARAQDQAGQAVANSRNYNDHLWHGRLLWAAGKRVEAEKALLRARDFADGAAEPWVALVQYQVRMGQRTKATATIEEARQKLSAEAGAVALGHCYEAVGLRDKAEEHFRTALADRPNDVRRLQAAARFYLRGGQTQKAETLLRRILDPALKAPEGDVFLARRGLTAALAMGGDPRRFHEALAMIDENLKPGGSELDRRIKAAVLAARPKHHREAIALLEESFKQPPRPTPDHEFLLARLYELNDQGPKARERMVALLTAHADNPFYMAHHIRSLLRSGEHAEAESWLRKLRELQPHAFSTAALQARALATQGKGQETLPAIKDFVEGKDSEPREPAERARLAAVLLEELAYEFPSLRDTYNPPAEAYYRRHVTQSGRPDSVLALAAYLARRGRQPEAFDLCDRAWDNCPPGTVAMTNLAILRAGQADAGQAKRLENRLTDALKKEPLSVGLLTVQAYFYDYQGRYDESEACYRKILTQAPTDVPTLNNLAYLLALRGRGAEALPLINRAIERAGTQLELLDTRAVVHLSLNKPAPALADLQEAIDATPALLQPSGPIQVQQTVRNPSGVKYFHLAQAWQMSGDRAAGAAAFRKAGELGLTEGDLHPLEQDAYRKIRTGQTPRKGE